VRVRQADAVPARLLPVHGAVRRLRRRMPRLRRCRLSSLQALPLGDDPRRRHGPPRRPPVPPPPFRALPGFRIRDGRRADLEPPARRRRSAALPRERPPVPGAVPMRVPLSWLREYVDVELEPERLAERLTLLGMEVQGIERRGDDWQNVV